MFVFRYMAPFERFIRYGDAIGSAPEAKFNPWHERDTGRFTTGPEGPGMGGRPRTPFRGGGGSMGGGGADASWTTDPPPPKPHSKQGPHQPPLRAVPPIAPAAADHPDSAHNPDQSPPSTTTIKRNGYRFEIDDAGRTRSVSGNLQSGVTAARSRAEQSRAGEPDRQPADDGGHYIAVRFNGPNDAFNHFAQDRNFNRGTYRALEDGWAKSVAEGNKVWVRIVPSYSGGSRRPDILTVTWRIGVKTRKRKFANRHGGR